MQRLIATLFLLQLACRGTDAAAGDVNDVCTTATTPGCNVGTDTCDSLASGGAKCKTKEGQNCVTVGDCITNAECSANGAACACNTGYTVNSDNTVCLANLGSNCAADTACASGTTCTAAGSPCLRLIGGSCTAASTTECVTGADTCPTEAICKCPSGQVAANDLKSCMTCAVTSATASVLLLLLSVLASRLV